MDGQDRGAYGFTYSMLQTGPGVRADEVESNLSAIEVVIRWDSDVVHVSHMAQGRSFYVGEESSGKAACDYFIPSQMLGTTRAPIVISSALDIALVILPRAQGYVDIPRQGRVSLSDLVASGHVRASDEIVGAYEYALAPGVRARMELEGGALAFEVGHVNAGKRIPVGLLAAEPEALLYTGLSFLLHIGLVVAFAFFMPQLHGDDSEAQGGDRILMMQKLLDAAAAREQEDHDTPQPTETQPDRSEGGTGAAAKSEAGAMGNPVARDTGHKSGVAGPAENPDPHLAKLAAIEDAARFGLIGYLAAMAGGDPNAPTAPWGRDTSLGRDDRSARGNMFGDTIGDSLGTGGLGLTGGGEGGGGFSENIGLGEFGVGQGAGPGSGPGIGVGRGQPGGGHRPKAPQMRELASTVNGRLGPEIIQRIVRQNFGRFRYCYENGMRKSPNLQGRVTVKFIIGRSGAVAMAADGGSDLPDREVVQCVVRGFANLSFPEPEGGMVTVAYPIMFSPGE
jgi:hypothetical protein